MDASSSCAVSALIPCTAPRVSSFVLSLANGRSGGNNVLPAIMRLNDTGPVELKIGRSRQQADIILSNCGRRSAPLMISRCHAKLVRSKDPAGRLQWKIVDMGSRNGLWLNGLKVAEATLQPQDVVTFGGGGLLPMGTYKDTIASDFVYIFSANDPFKSTRRRVQEQRSSVKRDVPPPPSGDEVDEAQLKRQRISRRQLLGSTHAGGDANAALGPSGMDGRKSPPSETDDSGDDQFLVVPVAAPHASADPARTRCRAKRGKENGRRRRSVGSRTSTSTSDGASRGGIRVVDAAPGTSPSLALEQLKSPPLRPGTVKVDSLRPEFTCPICLEFFMRAQTLGCGHSFCRACIAKSMRCSKKRGKHKCPVCRAPINKLPVNSCALDNAVAKLLDDVPPSLSASLASSAFRAVGKPEESAERQSWRARQVAAKEAEKREEKMMAKLHNVIEKAKRQGKKFLNIRTPWKREERELFSKGVQLYVGQARQMYCKTTGMRPDFIDSQPLSTLRTAAVNVGVAPDSWVDMTPAALRSRLHLFIRHG